MKVLIKTTSEGGVGGFISCIYGQQLWYIDIPPNECYKPPEKKNISSQTLFYDPGTKSNELSYVAEPSTVGKDLNRRFIFEPAVGSAIHKIQSLST